MSKSLVVAAHQPNFMPYLGFFDKMNQCDIFVIRDECLYVKDDYHRRNRIRINGQNNETNPQFAWLSVPAIDSHDYIKHIQIKDGPVLKGRTWKQNLIHEISAQYQTAPHFQEYFPELQRIIESSNNSLIDFNMQIIRFLSKVFGIEKQIVFASELGLKPSHYSESDGDASEDLVAICKKLGANVYLSGSGGRGYLNLSPFEREGIEVRYQDYSHPAYKQSFAGFIPNMAAIDALFCVGKMPESELLQIGGQHDRAAA